MWGNKKCAKKSHFYIFLSNARHLYLSLKKDLQHDMLFMEYIDWSVIARYINSNLRFRSNTLRINMFPETQNHKFSLFIALSLNQTKCWDDWMSLTTIYHIYHKSQNWTLILIIVEASNVAKIKTGYWFVAWKSYYWY